MGSLEHVDVTGEAKIETASMQRPTEYLCRSHTNAGRALMPTYSDGARSDNTSHEHCIKNEF